MKKLIMTMSLFSFMFLFLANNGHAQTTDTAKVTPVTETYFIGKWKGMIKGIPQGDSEVTFVFEKKDGKLTGAMIDPKQNVTTNFDGIDIKEGVLSTKFTAQGYEVNMSLKKKDDDNFAGSLMEQFEVSGTRIKQ